MDDKKEYEPLFPLGYELLNVKFEKFQHVLSSIDYQIDNSMADKAPQPTPNPPGVLPINPELRRQRKEFLERTREKRVANFKAGMQKHIVGFDDKKQAEINARIDFQTSRNGFKEYSKDDLKAVRKVMKEDKASFDYMAANHFNRFQLSDKSVAGEKENIEAWGDRYNDMLDKYRGKSDVETTKESSEFEKDY